MRRIFAALVLLTVAGCGMSDADVRQAKAECRAKGGEPVVMAHLYGSVAEVRCL